MNILLYFLMAIVVLTTTVTTANAANPQSQLLVKVWTEGTVVFVKPTKMSRTESSIKVSDLEYDIALNTQSDTIIVNCSIVIPKVLPLDSLRIESMGPYAVEKIYQEPMRGGKWRCRLSVPITMDDFSRIAQMETPPLLSFGEVEFKHSNKKWEDCKRAYALALETIKLNKKN